MTEPTKNIHRNEESTVAIAAQTTLDAAKEASKAVEPAEGSSRASGGHGSSRDGTDQIPLIMGALEKLASATDQMAQQLGDRLDEVRAEFSEDLENARDQNLRSVFAAGFDAIHTQVDERFAAARAEQAELSQRLDAISQRLDAQEESLRAKIEDAASGQRADVEQLEDRIAALAASLDEFASRLAEQTDTITSRVHDARNEVREAISDSQRELREAITSTQESFAQAIVDSIVPLQESLVAQRAEIAKGQRGVVSDLAEGIALSQASADKRFDQMESWLQDWKNDAQGQLERWNSDQNERLGAVERESREVSEVGKRLERNHAEMMAVFEREKERADQLEADRRHEQARRVNNSGVARYHSGDFEQARKAFEQAVDLDQTFAEAYNNLGLCLTEMGDHDEATVAFEAAIELNPDLGASYNNLGYVLYLQENFEAAIEMYKEAIGREHDTSAAYTNLGNAYQKLGQTDRAVDAWRQALDVDPTNERAQQYLERFAGGSALVNAPDPQR